MKESRVKHLELIHNVVDRLSHKSFLVKSWSITAVSALMAFGIDKEDYRIFIVGFPVSLLFWYLDSHYLLLEKSFRKLYENAIIKEVKLMSMDNSEYKLKIKLWSIAKTPTIWPIYVTEILLLSLGVIYSVISY